MLNASRTRLRLALRSVALAAVLTPTVAWATPRITRRAASDSTSLGRVVFATGIPGNVVKTITDLNGGQVLPGDVLQVEITILNAAGAAAATQSVVDDNIPSGTTYVPNTLRIVGGASAGNKTDAAGDDQAEFAVGPNRVRFRVGANATAAVGGRLNPGIGTRVRFSIQINANATNGQVISNQGFLTYRDASNDAVDVEPSGPVQGSPGPTTVVVVAPDLTIAKSHVGNFTRGQPASYTLAVSNAGGAPSSGAITVSDVLPASLTFVSATGAGWSCSAVGQTVTCTNAGPVAAGATLPAITLTVDVASNAPSTVTNTATVSGGGDSDNSNNSSSDPTTIGGAPDLAITKTHSGSFTVGSNGAYTIGVSNVGTSPTTGPITVTDVLPNGLTFVSGSGSGWTCSAVAQSVTCTNAGPVSAGANLPSIALTVSVGVAAIPTVTNTATVSTTGDANGANDSASDPTAVNPAPAPDLAIQKSHVGNFTVGGSGTYTLTVTNVGTAATSGPITVSDVLPTGLTYTSATGTGWSCSAVGQSVTCASPGPLSPPSALPAISLNVDVGPAAAPSVTNTASVATSGDGNASNDVASDPTTVNPAPTPDLTIAKSHTGSFTVGTNGTYTLTVTNVGAGATTAAIAVTDVLPNGLTYVSATGSGWSCSVASQTVTCTHPGPVAPSASLPVITLTVSVGSAAVPTVTNTATVATPGDANGANDSASDPTAVSPAPAPDLSLAKTHTGSFVVGSNGSYQLTVSNVGAGATTGPVTVTDALPTGLTFVSGSGTGWSCSAVAQTVTCTTPGPVAPAATLPVITVTVAVGTAAVPSVVNTAVVSTSGDANAANDAASDPTTVNPAPAPDLTIAKSHSGAFTVGSNGAYTLLVSNVGSATTTGTVTVSDPLPTGLTYVSATGTGWSCSAVVQVVTCTHPGPVAPSASLPPVALTVSVSVAALPSVTNTATVATPGDLNAGNDAASDPTPIGTSGIDASIAKTSAPSTFVVGSNATYTLTISNAGTSPTTGPLTVTDTLPVGTTFVSATAPTYTCGVVSGVLTCTRSTSLAAGALAPITVVVSVGAPAVPTVTNRAHVTTTGDTNPTNDVAQVANPTVTPPDLSIAKSASPTSFIVGQPASFTLVVRNVGGSAASGAITVTDTLPAGVAFASASGTGWSCTNVGAVVTCTSAATLAPGLSSSITLHVTVTAPAVPSITNTAHVTAPGDANSSNDAGSVTVPVALSVAPDVTVQKVAVGTFTVGQPATYQITVTNAGTGPTTAPVTVTDVLQTSVSFVSATGNGWSCNTLAQTVTCTYAAVLAVAQSTVITLVVIPTAAASPSLTNTAAVATAGDGNGNNNSSTVSTPVAAALDLSLQKTLNGALTKGSQATYTLTLANVGQVPTSGGITVVDSLPAGLAFVSASGGAFTCSASGAVVSCTRSTPPLNPNEQLVITMVVNVLSSAPDVIANGACVKTAGDANPSNDCATDTHPVASAADVTITKSHAGPAAIGQNVTFTLRMRNVGTAPTAVPITVDDPLPSGLTYVSATGTGWSCTASNGSVNCARNSALAAGDSSDITLTAKVQALAVPSVTNCARVISANDANAANNQSCDVVPVAGDYRFGIEKQVSKPETEVGDVLEYQVTVSNAGATAIPDGFVTDLLPTGFEYLKGSARLNSQAVADPSGAPGPELTFPIGALSVGGRAVLRYRVRVGASARPGANVNSAKAFSALFGASSPTVTATVTIRPGLFDERGAIVGKVFQQCDCDHNVVQNAGEVGIPGVRVYLEDGTSAITDVEGKYNFSNVAARLHVVKVDRTTLPEGSVLVPTGTRNGGDGYSRFADLKAGELLKADFVEASGSSNVVSEVLARRRAGEITHAGPPTPEELALGISAARSSAVSTERGLSSQATSAVSANLTEGARSSVAGSPAATGVGSGGYRPLFAGTRLNDGMSQLPVTPLRAMAQLAGKSPAAVGTVHVDVTSAGIPADGRTSTAVKIRLPGTPGSSQVVTLEASVGRWMVRDEDVVQNGVQVTQSGLEATYTLMAPYLAGAGEVRATTSDATGTSPVNFVPAPRPLIAAGILNARVDLLSVLKGGASAFGSGNGFEDAIRDVSFDNDSGKVHGGLRGAMLVKGRVFGNQLLTLSYDSERDRQRTLFRDIRPDEAFPVYGDGALREFDAQSNQRFFAQLDRGTSFTRVGDFTTTRADDRRVLSAYDRTMNGAVEHLEGDHGALTVFASNDRSHQVVDEMPARGISGPYPLSRSGLVNSERVEIITRDRNQPSLILARTLLTRFADYTIEPLTGRLVLRQPLNPVDESLNPVSIRVAYEVESGSGESMWTYGGDAALRLTSSLEVGASYAHDETDSGKNELYGVNTTVRLAPSTFLIGEFARTDDGAGLTGDAQRFELRHATARFEVRLFGARSDSAFLNRSSTFIGGRTELGARWSASLTDRTRLLGEALRTRDNVTEGTRDGFLIGVERRLSARWRGELGYRYAKEDGVVPASAYTFGAVPNNTSALRAKLTADIVERRASLFGEFEQDIQESDQHRAAIGGEYVLFNRARLYGRHEWISSFGGAYALNTVQDQQLTSIGVDADYLQNTQLFSEYRARDAFNGRDAEASIGVRRAWTIAKGVSLNTAFSRVSPLAGNGLTPVSGQLATATSVAGGLEITKSPLWKGTGRLEYRAAETGDNVFGSLGFARKVNRDVTVLGRSVWDVAEGSVNETRARSQLGISWRETDRNQWNVLARYENHYDHVSGGVDGSSATDPTRDLVHIVASLVNYQPSATVTLSGRYAAKFATTKTNGTSDQSTSQLLMGRGLFDLTKRVDAGLIGSMLFSNGVSSRSYGLGGELGMILMTNMRVAAGYNLFGFKDKDLNTFGTTRKGPYLELGFKFDESLFGVRTAESPCSAACQTGGRRE
ncbi:MAG: hypothetical protein U0132_05580 [Gemmatimonadaceae bacterium]